MTAKPTVEALGIDPGAQAWQRSGEADGSIEIAFARAAGTAGEAGNARTWVLMRVAGDPEDRILVFDRNEWDCFLDGVRNGEFDDAAEVSRLERVPERARLARSSAPAWSQCPGASDLLVVLAWR